jgi:hypothetical protein
MRRNDFNAEPQRLGSRLFFPGASFRNTADPAQTQKYEWVFTTQNVSKTGPLSLCFLLRAGDTIIVCHQVRE